MKVLEVLLDLFGGNEGVRERSAAELLAVVRRAGAPWERVVLTRNRRIMASVGNRGRDLRLNEAFAAAPDAVLAAVSELFTARNARRRNAAREAEHTMRHEMIHLWQHVEGLPVDHGPAFRRMARRLDVHPRATRNVEWMER